MENELKNSYKTAHRPAMKRTSADIHLEFGIGKGKFIRFLFFVVAKALYISAEKLKLSYYQVNILVYFFILPFIYLSILDAIFGFHYLKAAGIFTTLGFFLGCRDFSSYSDRLFAQSVKFLKYFNRFGLSYESASVWICVVLPGLLLVALLLLK
jgi:hypothetical protein